jgi:transcriptional regulator with XRE-family HTH domain
LLGANGDLPFVNEGGIGIVRLANKIRMAWMTRDQCRAARTLLHMTQPQLAKRAGCSLTTLVNYELDRRYVTEEMIQAIQHALEAAGAVFINGDGVRLRRR